MIRRIFFFSALAACLAGAAARAGWLDTISISDSRHPSYASRFSALDEIKDELSESGQTVKKRFLNKVSF